MCGSQAGDKPRQVGFLASWHLAPFVQLYKEDSVRKDVIWRDGGGGRGVIQEDCGGHPAGDSDGWVFCGCLAGDLWKEWIQKRLLFVSRRGSETSDGVAASVRNVRPLLSLDVERASSRVQAEI